MTEETVFLGLGVLAAIAVVYAITQAVLTLAGPERKKLRQRLDLEAGVADAPRQSAILLKRPDSLPAMLAQYPSLRTFDQRLQLVYPKATFSAFLAICFAAGATLAVLLFLLFRSPLVSAVAGLMGGLVPLLVVAQKLSRRQRQLADQLVDALDFLSRILRAGHSLSTGLQMVGQELPDPIASEFRKVYEKHSLGQPLERTLVEAAARMSLNDFSFFVTSVAIQRQTGGNLAEILDNIGKMVRDRIRLRQHVGALTAEGRITGYMLLALPVVIFFVIMLMNPGYAATLINTPLGRTLLVIAVALQVIGFFIMKKIVTIKV